MRSPMTNELLIELTTYHYESVGMPFMSLDYNQYFNTWRVTYRNPMEFSSEDIEPGKTPWDACASALNFIERNPALFNRPMDAHHGAEKTEVGSIREIAKTAHKLYREQCKHEGEKRQPKWSKLTAEHKDTMYNTIQGILSGDIDSPLESHAAFVIEKISNGWMHGKNYDRARKINPRLCAFEGLSRSDRWKEIQFFTFVKLFREKSYE